MSNKYLGPADRQLIAEKWAAYARRGSNGTLDKNSRKAYNPELAQRRFQESLRRRGKPLNRTRAANE